MIKKFGMTFGGLQQKILNLVLIFLLALVGVFGGVSFFQSNRLTHVVGEAREEQQTAIREVSGETIHQVIEGSMIKTNALQAYIANDMFTDVRTDITTMQCLAQGLFENREKYAPERFVLPGPAENGVLSVQVLHEAGVDPGSSEDLGIAAQLGDTMIAMCENSVYLEEYCFGLADGTHVAVDRNAGAKYDENGDLIPFPVRERPWYRAAVQAGEVCFTGIEADAYTGRIGVECAAPVYVDGKLVGVVGADLFLDSMAEYISNSAENGGSIGQF